MCQFSDQKTRVVLLVSKQTRILSYFGGLTWGLAFETPPIIGTKISEKEFFRGSRFLRTIPKKQEHVLL